MMDCVIFAYLFIAVLLSGGGGMYIQPDDIDAHLLPTYDFIIVGGGVAGLVMANELSGRSNITVLVLEAGPLDNGGETVMIPALIGQDLWTKYDWNFSTTAQMSLDQGKRTINSGRAVGGSSILNGLVWTRGAKADYDAWVALGNPDWGWDSLEPYFESIESYTPHDWNARKVTGPRPKPVVPGHGFGGPVQVAFPNFRYDQSDNFLQGVASLGLPLVEDMNLGAGAGASTVPSSMHWLFQARADARNSYLQLPGMEVEGAMPHIATEQTVTRILLEKDNVTTMYHRSFRYTRRAVGVAFTSPNGTQRTVTCAKEVILAAGALVSPALLQVSGIGPAELLLSINVTVQIDLPGVGENLQDHPVVPAFYNSRDLTGDTLRAAHDLYTTNRSGPLTAPLISTVAFPPLHLLAPNTSSFLLQQAASWPPANYLAKSTRHQPTLVAGYALQRQIQLSLLARDDTAASEIMADSVGTLSVSAMRPLSRGTVRALSSSLFPVSSQSQQSQTNIAIDPRYCSNPLDCSVLVAALQFNARLISTAPMQALQPAPAYPWVSNSTGQETEFEEGLRLLTAVEENLRTEFHPAGTTAMMPLDKGGVVDPQLKVYGTVNLRVVDAGVFPLMPAAHLQAAVYAVAARAAGIVRDAHGFGADRATRRQQRGREGGREE